MHQFKHNILFLLLVTSSVVAQDFSITVNSVGIGNNWRAGDITPLHLSVTSTSNEPTAAWIQWEVPDADGDHVLWGRQITLAPQSTTSTWLYAPTKTSDNNGTAWTIRLRSWEQSEPTGELHVFRFSPQSVSASLVDATEGRIAVFGTRRLGLSGYGPISPFETKQEATKIVSGLTADDLPDAWPSYLSLDALVWADATPQFSFRQSEALLEWIQRGGHFIITLPTIGDPWSIGTQRGPLPSLLGDLRQTLKQVPLSWMRNILGREHRWPRFDLSIRVFGSRSDDWSSDLTPVLWLDDGSVIGLQRTVGHGAVTIIGVDLGDGRLTSLGLPEADIFWNRVLGRRSDTPSANTLQMLQDSDQRSHSLTSTSFLSAGRLAAQKIAMSGTASTRLGIVFVLVVLYWLIGGPVGYYILQRKKKQRWSWVWFAGTACVFSIGTWLFAAKAADVPDPLKHVTIIDHVYGELGQRAMGWFSVFLPNFGRSEINILGDENNLLLPWTSPDSSTTPPFIDRREILINLDHVPDSFLQPARATTANFSFHWLGGIEHDYYGSFIRIAQDDAPSVVYKSNNTPLSLKGSITHHLSKELSGVTILFVTGTQQTPTQLERTIEGEVKPWVQRLQSGQTLNEAYMWRLSTWQPDDPLYLEKLVPSNANVFSEAVSERYKLNDMFDTSRSVSNSQWQTRMEMLSLYSHLKPPVYQKIANVTQGPESHHSIRKNGRELDFSKWFGRPCIIIMGFMHDAPIPVPITVDGVEATQSTGVTFIRWIYPLEQPQ